MPPVLWRVCWIACLAALALAGIDWGLPSADAGPRLFGERTPWDGAILAGYDIDRTSEDVGADVDRDPVRRSAWPAVLNADDSARAAIVRRYRLFSHQPDEMITFMALQQMNPAAGQLDPRLYQYGGAWIYPVGGLLKAAGALGLIDVRTDKAFYYDRPAAFGRFYVVARLYTLFGYVLLMTAVGMILMRLTDEPAAAAAGAAVVGALPVVFALAHEAKPHVLGVAWVLFAVLAARRWVKSGEWRDAVLCGALVGLAAGTVLSAAVAVLVPLTMVFLRHERFTVIHDSPTRRLAVFALAMLTAIGVFSIGNPYVVLHAVRGDAVLASNLANTKAMYGVGTAAALIGDGSARLLDALSWPAAALAAGGFVLAVTRRRRVGPLGVLLTVPAAAVLVQFFAFAAGKPAEYARFALLPVAVFGVLGVWALSTIVRPWLRRATLAAAPLAVLAAGTWPYVVAFSADAGDDSTRVRAATALRALPGGTLDVWAEPAPYSAPAADLWAWRVTLLPPGAPPTADAAVRAIDDPSRLGPAPAGYRRQVVAADGRLAPVTWANKPFELLVREKKAD